MVLASIKTQYISDLTGTIIIITIIVPIILIIIISIGEGPFKMFRVAPLVKKFLASSTTSLQLVLVEPFPTRTATSSE